MKRTETIIWHDARKSWPEVATTVLVRTTCGADRVLPAYWTGARWYPFACQEIWLDVAFWAAFPEGPIG
jgi:hypothetical protein